MSAWVTVSTAGEDLPLQRVGAPIALDALVPGGGKREWEVEIGVGKGRYLLDRAAAEPEAAFLGIEVARKYQRILVRRARRRGLGNLAAIHGEALGVLATALPRRFAGAVHVYFPDPWPKARHHRRRLFDPDSLDLVLDLLAPDGALYFATDHVEYGEVVEEILRSSPDLDVRVHPGPWPGGARTNYEAKYEKEGRPIRRLVARLGTDRPGIHPDARKEVLVAFPAGAEG